MFLSLLAVARRHGDGDLTMPAGFGPNPNAASFA
jgi:hypothetical protein